METYVLYFPDYKLFRSVVICLQPVLSSFQARKSYQENNGGFNSWSAFHQAQMAVIHDVCNNDFNLHCA